MADYSYWLAGCVSVPEDKKQELNECVLKIMEKGGIRKTEEIELNGKKLTVVKKPAPDSRGLVSFDYSIFEKEVREPSIYDMNTCELRTGERGYCEFAIVMNTIMALQESYSGGSCFLMDKSLPLTYISGYINLARSMTGMEFSLESRERIFDMALFFHENGTDLKSDVFINCLLDSLDFVGSSKLQLYALLDMLNEDLPACNDSDKISSRTEIKGSRHGARREFLYQVMQELVRDDDDGFFRYLSGLVTLDMNERRKLAADSGPYGAVAETSLYMLPASLIHIYALVKGMGFWETWNLLPDTKYGDVFEEEGPAGKTESGTAVTAEFYKIVMRENQDEFLEFWDGGNMVFSRELEESMADWRDEVENAPDPGPEAVAGVLADIILDLGNDWGCRLADREFVDLFLANRDDPSFRKALSAFREMMDSDVELFPELTRRQAIDWVIKNYRDRHDSIILSAYQSLLVNEKQRRKILGF